MSSCLTQFHGLTAISSQDFTHWHILLQFTHQSFSTSTLYVVLFTIILMHIFFLLDEYQITSKTSLIEIIKILPFISHYKCFSPMVFITLYYNLHALCLLSPLHPKLLPAHPKYIFTEGIHIVKKLTKDLCFSTERSIFSEYLISDSSIQPLINSLVDEEPNLGCHNQGK